jgi:energy-coupling factor transporter ATP-binding protein EcfA2
MQKLKINLKNCYGIRDLKFEFDFQSKKTYAIYAPNGFMKTSFSKTFSDFSKRKETKDLVFSDRTTLREILNESETEINPENIFVIDPYNEDYSSEKTSLLLVNQDIKRRHDEALRKIENSKDELIKQLKLKSGVTGRIVTPETEIQKLFPHESIYDAIESFRGKSTTQELEKLLGISYAEIFNDKTVPFLESGKVKDQIQEYIEKYNELVTASPILSKQFNHYHAKTVQKNLADNGFFAAKHSVRLFNGTGHDNIESAEALDARIDEEKKKIFTSEALSKKFEAIDTKLKNDDLRRFRDYLFEHQEIIPFLSDFRQLQKDLWAAYILGESGLLDTFLTEYSVGKSVIKEAIQAAKDERTEWENVVNQFNTRFTVPFKLSVSNQADVILKGEAPSIAFEFEEGSESRTIDRKQLLSILSQGEKRALYILNILFEINARQQNPNVTFLIVDDIADSFDYKNKYAIIEYLHDVQNSGKFFSIFLSHNFDFYRTISSRLGVLDSHRLFVEKNIEGITLVKETYQRDPFKLWIKNLDNPRYLLASIAFVRNLADYCGCKPEFTKLTSLLHEKQDSLFLQIKDLEEIYRKVLQNLSIAPLPNQCKPVFELLFEQAEIIYLDSMSSAELESKIILAISCRLLAERFMIRKINNPEFVSSIKRDQTRVLYDRFCSVFLATEIDAIKTLDQVNLMTPENIHLNSFMYEPILDMSPDNLKTLYRNLKLLSP